MKTMFSTYRSATGTAFRDTSRGRKTASILGTTAAVLLAVFTFFAVPDGSNRMTAAAVTDGVAGSHASHDAAANGSVESTENTPVPATETPADANAVKAEPAEEVIKEAAGKHIGAGEASYYGERFAGRRTANGERFDPYALTAAHRSLPFGSKVRVTNAANGRSVIVRVNDRGPYAEGRLIDVSRGAAERLGMVRSGTAKVELELIS